MVMDQTISFQKPNKTVRTTNQKIMYGLPYFSNQTRFKCGHCKKKHHMGSE